MLIAVIVAYVLIAALAIVVVYLFVCNDQSDVEAHKRRVLVEAHEKRIATLERAEGIGDDATLVTWRRPGNGG